METVEQIQQALSQTKDPQQNIDLLNQFAYLVRNSDPKTSQKKSEEALTLSKKINYKKGEAGAYSNLGFGFLHEANHDKAFSNLLEALNLFEELNDEKGISDAQYNLGVLNLRMGSFDQSIELLHKSLAIREKLGDKNGQASCYFQLTYLNQHFKDFDSAYQNANRSIELRKEINDQAGLGASLMVLGDVHFKRGDLQKARELFWESLELRKNSGEKIGYFVSLVRWADLHVELKEYKIARDCCTLGIRSAFEESLKFGVLRFQQTLARIEVAENNLQEAKKVYLEALEKCREFSFKSIEFEVLDSLTEVYKREGNYKEALNCYEQFHKIKEEVISSQNSAQLKSLRLIGEIEFARKEADIEKEKNSELNVAYSIIASKNKDITDSIHYAKRIQTSLLPTEIYIERILKNSNDNEA